HPKPVIVVSRAIVFLNQLDYSSQETRSNYCIRTTMSQLGTFRAVYLVALCCVGSFLFAYDTGIIGGILTFEGFQQDFRYGPAQKASVGSNSTSLLQAGAFFSCFFIWPFTAKYGRRRSIILASVIFCAGAVVQTVNTHSLAAFYVARVVSGIGVGMATVVIPMYSAEMAPKTIRGTLGSMFQFFFTMGVMTSYFIDYGVSKHVKASTLQWQIPVGLQLVPGAILGLGMLLCKESTRWLAKKGRREEALQSLIWVRGGEHTPEVEEEFAEIIPSIEEEQHQKEVLTLKELNEPVSNLPATPPWRTVFAAVGAGQNNLLITGFFGLVKVISCLFYLLFLVERIGRRGSLLGGAPLSIDQGLTSTAVASMTMIYLEAMSYNISWGPAPWVTPHAVQNLGWKTFLMFCIFNWALVVFVWFFIKETKGKSLEEMDCQWSRALEKVLGSDAENSPTKRSEDQDAARVQQNIDRKE
ncbi:Quinate permease, partial [Colletotrichum tanaceti]